MASINVRMEEVKFIVEIEKLKRDYPQNRLSEQFLYLKKTYFSHDNSLLSSITKYLYNNTKRNKYNNKYTAK